MRDIMRNDYVNLVEQLNQFKEYKSVRKLSDDEIKNEWGEYYGENGEGHGIQNFPNAFQNYEDFDQRLKETTVSYVDSVFLTNVDNTDAGDVYNKTGSLSIEESVSQVIQLFKDEDKDVLGIICGFKSQSAFPPSIILSKDGKKPYLIGGNTRLCIATALKLKPPVKVIRI
jgi:hypothetical protein